MIVLRLDFFEDFQDPYLQKMEGRGIFLAGLVLGMISRGQVGKGGPIDASPMYKQLHFGRMQRRDLLRLMARVPELGRVYNISYAGMIESLCAEAGKLLMEGEPQELGVEGNFAFSIAFLNAPDYFFGRIFKKQAEEEGMGQDWESREEENSNVV